MSVRGLQSHKTKIESLLYGEAVAMSLILYAEKDEDFAKELRKLLYGWEKSTTIVETPAINNIEILLPKNTDDALRKAEWLIQVIEEDYIPGAQSAGKLLGYYAYSKAWGSPKQIVVGVVQVAIPGITLGRIKRRKVMTILIRDDLSPKVDLDVSRKINQACLGVLNRALRMAGGDVHKVEPEIGGWFFGDMDLAFRVASATQLKKIEDELTKVGAIHYSVKKDNEQAILAMSPSVNDSFWNLESLD